MTKLIACISYFFKKKRLGTCTYYSSIEQIVFNERMISGYVRCPNLLHLVNHYYFISLNHSATAVASSPAAVPGGIEP